MFGSGRKTNEYSWFGDTVTMTADSKQEYIMCHQKAKKKKGKSKHCSMCERFNWAISKCFVLLLLLPRLMILEIKQLK